MFDLVLREEEDIKAGSFKLRSELAWGVPWKFFRRCAQSKAKNNSVFEIEFLKKGSVANKSKNKNPLKIIDTAFMLVFLETQHLLPFKSCFVPYFVWMYTPSYAIISLHFILFFFLPLRGLVQLGITSTYSSLFFHGCQPTLMFKKIQIQQIFIECKVMLCAVFCNINEFF